MLFLFFFLIINYYDFAQGADWEKLHIELRHKFFSVIWPQSLKTAPFMTNDILCRAKFSKLHQDLELCVGYELSCFFSAYNQGLL